MFVDEIQAFPSIVVALVLPLPEREADTNALLREAGFDEEATLEIIADNLQNSEWGEVSTHMQEVIAAFQEDQWAACD